jgi:hypothetical protein
VRARPAAATEIEGETGAGAASLRQSENTEVRGEAAEPLPLTFRGRASDLTAEPLAGAGLVWAARRGLPPEQRR